MNLLLHALILFSHLSSRNWGLIDRSTIHCSASLTRQCKMSLAGERASEVKKVSFFIMDIPADSSTDIQMKASLLFFFFKK